MKKYVLCFLSLIGMNCGVVDTTDTGIVARIYNPDGTPAAEATVSVFQANDSTHTPVEVVTTDRSGVCGLAPIKAGSYNIWAAAEKGDLVGFQNSIYLSSNIKEVSNDTLGNPVTVNAIVELQPNNDPRTVTVQVLGTYKYSNVQQNGHLLLDGMAPGIYTLRLVSTLPGYTPTYQDITVKPDKNKTGVDTMNIINPIVLIYTGIPVVTGLKATYDTASGIVNLQWDSTTFWDFQDYVIYRDPYDSVILSTKPIAWRTDTTFSDTVFQNHLYTVDDTNNYHLKYRVAVRNNAGEQGITYRFADVIAVSPVVKKMRFDFSPSGYRDSISLIIKAGDTLRVIGRFISPINTTIASVTWKDIRKGTIIASQTFSAQQTVTWDTLRYCTTLLGADTVECSVLDSKGVLWKDSVSYSVMDSTLPSDSSEVARSYGIMGIGGDTVQMNSFVFIRANFTDRLSPSLKTATWTDLGKDSVISVDSLSSFGYGNGWNYQDSLWYSWPTAGWKLITCTIMDAVDRLLIDTIRVQVVN